VFQGPNHTNILKSAYTVRVRPVSQIDLPPELHDLQIDPARPLLVVDVDEVLAMFMRGFERFLVAHGLEMRIERFALFQSIFRPGDAEHLDVAAGRQLFDAFFAADPHDIDPAPGAAEALAELSKTAGVLILTNAPGACRLPRERWLVQHGFPYPMIVNSGLKGPVVAELAARTTGAVAFIDDLLPNLESVAEAAPRVRRFQMVADERLRPLAFTAPERHARIDEWPALKEALEAALSA
jgi:hypothetical protein